MGLTYREIVDRLESIEADIQVRQDDYETAANDYYRLLREYELRVAQVKLLSKKPTETAKKDSALEAIAASGDGMFVRFTDAEARFMSLKAVMGVLEKRSMVCMALLKAQTREAGPQPSWTPPRVAA